MLDADSEASSLDRVAQFLTAANRIAVIAHLNPDADAIGAVLGLAVGLRSLGKETFPVLSDAVPEYARFLEHSDYIASALPEGDLDVIVCADSADIGRIGTVYEESRARFENTPILNLDHHRTNPLYGQVNYVDPQASSSSELCYRVLHYMGAPIEPAAATALLFGIYGDTGAFQNAATTPGALETTAALVRAGGDSQRVAYELFESKSFAAARLWGRILSSIELDCERRIVFGCMSQRELLEEQASADETEGVAEYLRGIQEADVVMLMKETAEGDIRVSMRSGPGVDVSAIATALGGGGHRQAAGCTVAGPFAAAKDTLVDAYDRLTDH